MIRVSIELEAESVKSPETTVETVLPQFVVVQAGRIMSVHESSKSDNWRTIESINPDPETEQAAARLIEILRGFAEA